MKMRWIPCIILVYLAMALQLALSGFLTIGRFSPDLVLPAAIFIAINARREQALTGALLLGMAHDMISQRPFGIFSFAYAITALLGVGMQPVVYRDHPLTHFFVTLGAATITGALLWFNDWAYPLLHHLPQATRPSILSALGSALYTALAAPFILGLLTKARFLFGFRSAIYNDSPGYGMASQ